MLKRVFDIATSAMGLVVLSPLFIAVAAAVWAADGCPVLFRQTRVGRGFRRFSIWKFRTMTNGEVTGPGRFLRDARLDELPQLWNVLLGEMSLVGPRPEVPEFVDEASPIWRVVLQAKPGLVDPATLAFADEGMLLAAYADRSAAYRLEVLPRKLEISRLYLSGRSLATDLRVLCSGALLVGRRLAGR